jgi:hypothetical protein
MEAELKSFFDETESKIFAMSACMSATVIEYAHKAMAKRLGNEERLGR